MSIKTRFLIISDTHNATPHPTKDVAFHSPLHKADVLLHCGDLTMVGNPWEYAKALDMLANVDAELKLVIAGNHDISLDEAFYARRGQHMQRLQEADAQQPQLAREMWTGSQAKNAGITYLDEGTHVFTLNSGARLRVYASPYQPEFCDWAFAYARNQDRYNPPHKASPNAIPIAQNPVPDFPAIDVMMTHGPPLGIRDATSRNEHVGCEHLLRASRRCKPRLHCFGHIHEGWGAEKIQWDDESSRRIEVDGEKMVEEGAVFLDASSSGGGLEFGRDTLMVNASIMSVRYQPLQGPWVVDLDLEKETD